MSSLDQILHQRCVRWRSTASIDISVGEEGVIRDEKPSTIYKQKLASGELRPDENQRVVVNQMDNLYNLLIEYKHDRPKQNYFSKVSWISY